MLRDVASILHVPYANIHNGVQSMCEPSWQDIKNAIDNGLLEQRGFQSHDQELRREWLELASTPQQYDDCARTYHARRIAYFVVHRWSDAIILGVDGRIRDGSHRLRAAVFLEMEKVDVTILDEDCK